MTVYAESSAVLAWLLDQPGQEEIDRALRLADLVVASDLTLLECIRVIQRSKAAGLMDDSDSGKAIATIRRLSASWALVRVDEDVLETATRPFPKEPVRTLDAIHLATATSLRKSIGPLTLLTLDGRIVDDGRALGFDILPQPSS